MPQQIVKLPSLGDDADDHARVSFVYLKPGDSIKEGDDLIEMVTDKAVFNVPSPHSGSIVEFLVSEDDNVRVGDPICIVMEA